METVVILIMFMVGLSFVLKLTFMRPWQMSAEAIILAFVTINDSVKFEVVQPWLSR